MLSDPPPMVNRRSLLSGLASTGALAFCPALSLAAMREPKLVLVEGWLLTEADRTSRSNALPSA